jgi:shikimate kinase
VKGEDSLVVYLRASPQELWRRISEDPASASTRPRLTKGGLDEVVEVLAIRAPAYEQCADLVLDATLEPELMADEVDAYLADVG